MSDQSRQKSTVQPVTQGLGPRSGDVFRFTIWDLLVLTTFVALFFALPLPAQLGLTAGAIFVVVLCGPLLIVGWPTRVRRTAVLKSMLLPFLLRATGYSIFVLVLAGAAALCRMLTV